MNRVFFQFVVLVTLILTIGCSGKSAVTPDTPNDSSQTKISSLPLFVSDISEAGVPLEGAGMLGIYSVSIDKTAMTAEITSLRSASLPDVLEVVDITNFLQLWPCTDCVKIQSVSLDADGNVVVSIGIRHPFEAGDPFKPITGRNRGDLHVFNVEGTVFSNNPATSFPGLGRSTSNFRLLNANGYTEYLNPVIDEIYPTSATVHPYILHFDDYSSGNFDPNNPMGFASVTDPHPSGNLVMAMGCDYDFKDYVFALPDEPVDFIYVVGCTYAVSSASKAERFNPEYRVPQHLKKAANEVWVEVLENNLADDDTESSATLQINVVDISHGVPVSDALNEMRADSSVSAVSVEIPGVTAGVVNFSTTAIGGLGHDPTDPLVFEGDITNSAGGGEGTYTGLVKITDSYPPGLNESPLLDGLDGIKRVDPVLNPLEGLFAMTEFATYQTFDIYVEIGNDPPVAILNPNPARSCEGASIWFNGTESYDPDGEIVLYEFDFDLADGDPANFNADVTGTESRVQSYPYSVGNYWAALRVVDNLGSDDIDVVEVIITEIDGLDIEPYDKAYVTDENFGNIIFTPNGFDPDWRQNRQYGLQALARGSEYVYAIFYASGPDGDGVYIAKSGDSGASWGGYNRVYEWPSGAIFRGASINAHGSNVYVAVTHNEPDGLYFLFNDNHGEGEFNQITLSTAADRSSISVAVDPLDTNNVYIGAGEPYWGGHHREWYVYTSNTGPEGSFNEEQYSVYTRPTGTITQAYTSELLVAPNQDVYIFEIANVTSATYRSTDFGNTFTEIHGSYYGIDTPWGRDADFCFDPDDSNIIYGTVTFRDGTEGWRHSLRKSNNGGVTWMQMHHRLETGTNNGYTNIAVRTDAAGNVYVAYTDKSTGTGEVYARFSSDGAASFTSPLLVSDHPGDDAHVEIGLTVDGCDIIMAWLEDRNGTPRIVAQRG